jgi:hypothetical protein
MIRNEGEGGGGMTHNRNMIKKELLLLRKEREKEKKVYKSVIFHSRSHILSRVRGKRRFSRSNRYKNIIIKMTHGSTHTLTKPHFENRLLLFMLSPSTCKKTRERREEEEEK